MGIRLSSSGEYKSLEDEASLTADTALPDDGSVVSINIVLQIRIVCNC